ncbi:MAG: hypothetical protein IPM14_04280 [bacterium]|nr:hypothetical protein [bacterium]
MKAILLSTLLYFAINQLDGDAIAQTIWYVDKDAIGANTGRSWTDAWTSISDSQHVSDGINFDILQGGDTVYVSNGDYRGEAGAYAHRIYPAFEVYGLDGIVYDSEVVIAPAWHTGHNGDVNILPYNNDTQWILQIANITNLKLTGFNCTDDRTTSGLMFYLGGSGADGRYYRDSMIIMDNWNIIGNGRNGMFYLEGNTIKVTNSHIEQPENDLDNNTDPFGIAGGLGGHTIDGNTIIMRNGSMTTDAHRDGIQISDLGFPGNTDFSRRRFTISNNLIIDTNPNGVMWNNLIYNHQNAEDPPMEILIYNNILVHRKQYTGIGAIGLGRASLDPAITARVFNNTIIIKGRNPGLFTIWGADSMFFANNLCVVDTNINGHLNINAPTVIGYCDYNLYAEYGGYEDYLATYGVVRTFEAWQGLGYDVNSDTANSNLIVFTNKYGLDKADYYTTAGRDMGVDLSTEYPFLAYDILGNPRTGAWDIGALEYTESQSNNVRVRGKVYLQGPFNNNLMSTNLTQGSFLPNSQPYNQPPWNYNGNESFSSGPNSAMVDWVLVELRNAANPSQIISSRAAILKNDGLLLEPNGSEGVFFTNVDPGSYYIAIHHRNHLAIMSAAPVELSLTSALYDFTNAMNKAYGQNPMVELGTGKYGMVATDGNADGVVNTSDRDNVWLIQNGNMGYLEGDFNMNSGVTIHDVNQLWNINNGKTTQVP